MKLLPERIFASAASKRFCNMLMVGQTLLAASENS